MTEAIYKVGDILEFKDSQYFPEGMDHISGPFRALIIRVDQGCFTTYRLILFSKECNNFINRYMSILQTDIITKAKRVGHIDISLLRFEEKAEELKSDNEKLAKEDVSKYNNGDILTYRRGSECATAIVIGHSKKTDYASSTFSVFDYNIFAICKAVDEFKLDTGIPEWALNYYELVGHIDITGMSNEEIKKNLDYAIRFEYCDNRIAHAIQEHWVFHKLNDYDYCYYSVQDKLKYDLEMANEAKEELKKELDQAKRDYRCEKARVAYKLHEIGFTNDKIGEILGETPCVVSYLLSGRVN